MECSKKFVNAFKMKRLDLELQLEPLEAIPTREATSEG